MTRRSRKKGKVNKADENFQTGLQLIHQSPIFEPLIHHASVVREQRNQVPHNGWAVVSKAGTIYTHPTKLAAPEEWCYILAHCLLHLGLGHFQPQAKQFEWNVACDCLVASFLNVFKAGRRPSDIPVCLELPARNEELLYRMFCREGIPPELKHFGTAGPELPDMVEGNSYNYRTINDWQEFFARGLTEAVTQAVEEVSASSTPKKKRTGLAVQQALSWLISSFPLLGSLATEFEVIEDRELCRRMDISVAAVDATMKEIHINPNAGLTSAELRFVIAHELLHAGLRHDTRQQGREPYLWNVACDYVINGWLIEMGVGEFPRIGGLYDPQLKDKSAEHIYDIICSDLRRYRKLATLRGVGLGDILKADSDWWTSSDGVKLDEFYRNCLANGLVYHHEQGRGLLPLGLVEEIRTLSQPPVPWDVELAKWFDQHFASLERHRSYARPSRRQSSTPDIPRPSYLPIDALSEGRTYGVVLDTSGSMDRQLLAKALGAIASYSMSRDVPAVRVLFCDAIAYDAGYLPVETIAERLQIKGRGGTILQPGINLLQNAQDFPKDGPILIITDGGCDKLSIRREHAFILPKGHNLPFTPRGPVFRIF